MNKQRNGDLVEWYLARLRKNASQREAEQQLTPLTLVQTDKSLIQEIVMQSNQSNEKRFVETLAAVELSNQAIRKTQRVLFLLLCIALLGSVACFFIIVG